MYYGFFLTVCPQNKIRGWAPDRIKILLDNLASLLKLVYLKKNHDQSSNLGTVLKWTQCLWDAVVGTGFMGEDRARRKLYSTLWAPCPADPLGHSRHSINACVTQTEKDKYCV